MQGDATTVGQTEVASRPCPIRSAVLSASGSSALIQIVRHRGKRSVRLAADQTDCGINRSNSTPISAPVRAKCTKKR
jgi:hypothetical protein